MYSIKTLKNIRGKRIIVRVDFNVPIQKGRVVDDFRIQKALPTIQFLRKTGAKIILISHISDTKASLAPVAKYIQKTMPLKFSNEIIGKKTSLFAKNLKNGEVLLLENLRNDPREEKNSKNFATDLAGLGNIYVNEAFPVCHRRHASIVSLPKLLPPFAGFALIDEIKNLERVFKKPPHPFLFILGGAKFHTKIPLLTKFIQIADNIFIGGANMNNFLKDKGLEIGLSNYDKIGVIPKHILNSKKITIATDVIIKMKNGKTKNQNVEKVLPADTIKDVGSRSVNNLIQMTKKAKFVFWNGPLGYYEEGFSKATEATLKALAKSRAKTVIGGGDTEDLVSKLKLRNKFFFVSSGGGATLEFLAKGTLPGIKILG